MYCPNCGQENSSDARHCETCGTDLSKYTTSTPVSQSEIRAGQPVTPVAEYAGFWLRFAASLIDGVLIGFVSTFLYIPFFITLRDPDFTKITPFFLIVPLAFYVLQWLYYALMEASSKQGTLGKMLVGIIVTDENGKRISFGRATGRYFAKILSSMILYIGFLMIAFTPKKQGLHDILAITFVVKK